MSDALNECVENLQSDVHEKLDPSSSLESTLSKIVDTTSELLQVTGEECLAKLKRVCSIADILPEISGDVQGTYM